MPAAITAHLLRVLLLGAAMLCAPRVALAAHPAVSPPPETIATAVVASLQPSRVFAAATAPITVGYQTAPTPDADAVPPQAVEDLAPHVSPTLYMRREQFRGDGYSPGSTAQDAQEHLLKPAAGVMLNVPLD